MTLFACFPVCWFFAALAVLFVLVVLAGAYNRDAVSKDAVPEEAVPHQRSWWLIVAIIITIIVPAAMLLIIWLAPEW